MSNQLEKIKELIERRAVARIGGGESIRSGLHCFRRFVVGNHVTENL